MNELYEVTWVDKENKKHNSGPQKKMEAWCLATLLNIDPTNKQLRVKKVRLEPGYET